MLRSEYYVFSIFLQLSHPQQDLIYNGIVLVLSIVSLPLDCAELCLDQETKDTHIIA